MILRSPRLQRHHGDRGVILILFALTVTVIFVFAALVVGLGNARQTDRDTKNDVDAAMLAAASALDGFLTPSSTAKKALAVAKACDYMQRNGYGDRPCDVDDFVYPVNDAGLPYPPSGTTVGMPECIRWASSEVDTKVWFGGIAGRDTLNLGAGATGCRGVPQVTPPSSIPGIPGEPVPGALLPAAFSAGANCDGTDPGFDTSGSNIRIEGSIHANDNAKDGGVGNVVVGGSATYVDRVDNKGIWSDAASPTPTVSPVKDWPDGFSPSTLTTSLYAPGSSRALAYGEFYNSGGSNTFSGATPAGVYYRSGNAKVEIKGGFSVTPRTATIYIDPATRLPAPPVANGGTGVAETRTLDGITIVTVGGEIIVEPSNLKVRHFALELNQLFLFTNRAGVASSVKWCTTPVISLNSSNCFHFSGVLYAPRGAIQLAGQGNGQGRNPADPPACTNDLSLRGNLLGYGVKLNGSNSLLRAGSGSLVPTSTPGSTIPGTVVDGRISLGGSP
jgi:hypothetical protein